MATTIERLQREIAQAARTLENCVGCEAHAPLAREMVQNVAAAAIAKLRRVQRKLGELECGGRS